jgi:predicted enzyme related to lactoylglutathione lyase
MKNTPFLILIISASIGLGYAFRSIVTAIKPEPDPVRKVTSIGGIFFKCKDPKVIRDWYQANLGLNTNPYGAVFEWHKGIDSTQKGFTQWSPFKETTTYFEPSKKDFMINYRVADLDALVAELRQKGVAIVDTIQAYDYGKFVHIMDPEGNNIELWEPNDVVYEKMGIEMGLRTTK